MATLEEENYRRHENAAESHAVTITRTEVYLRGEKMPPHAEEPFMPNSLERARDTPYTSH